jgi:hypothetical protein
MKRSEQELQACKELGRVQVTEQHLLQQAVKPEQYV